MNLFQFAFCSVFAINMLIGAFFTVADVSISTSRGGNDVARPRLAVAFRLIAAIYMIANCAILIAAIRSMM